MRDIRPTCREGHRPLARRDTLTAPAWAVAWALMGLSLIWGSCIPGWTARRFVGQHPPRGASYRPAPLPAGVGLAARAIQDVRVGDRVRTDVPESGAGRAEAPAGVLPPSEPSVDGEPVGPATWRRVELVMPDRAGGDLEIVLLRPSWWVEANRASPGGSVSLSLPEMGAVGPARVLSVGPCPPVKPGTGRVVTGTYTHAGAEVLDVCIEGLEEPVGATPWHPFYSLDRTAYVPAEGLKAGERLQTIAGEARVASVRPRPGRHRVYNLEVHNEHVYRVSTRGVLVHNDSPGEMLRRSLASEEQMTRA